MLYAHGLDSFVAIWEAKLILHGEYFKNGFSFFDLLGLTPISGYPIGMLLILCFFLLITSENIMIAILLFDLVFTIIFVISSYFLAENLELNKTSKFFFVLILTSLPNIFAFSYYQASARYPFFAVLPFVLAFLLKFNKERKVKYLIYAVSISLILNLFHRMAIMVFVIIFLSILLFILDKTTKRDFLVNFHTKEFSIRSSEEQTEDSSHSYKHQKNFLKFINYIKNRFWIFGIIGLYAIGFLVFGTNLYNVFFRSKFNIYCFLMSIIDSEALYLLIQPIVDQWFHYGIPFLLFLLAIAVILFPKGRILLDKINKKSSNLKLIYFMLPFILTYQLIYSFYFLNYIVGIVGVILLDYLYKTKYRHYIWPVFGLLFGGFVTLYHFATATKVLPYLIIGLFVLIISITTIILLSIKNSKNWLKIRFGNFYNKTKIALACLIGVVVLNSMFIVDRSAIFTNRNSSIFEHVTKEEIEIAKFLMDNGFGTFESFDNTISIRIAALSGWLILQDPHNRGAFLLEDRNIANLSCQFTLNLYWPNMILFNCSNTDSKQLVYSYLYRFDCYSIDALIILKRYNIRYFISSRHTNTSNAWEYTVNSPFIESLYSYTPLVKITNNYYVWNTSTLYS